MHGLFTIGYETSTIEDFIATLQFARIETLVDVREVTVSRKRGFSKKSLASALMDCGIDYAHLRALGDPKEGREAARKGDIALFKRIYRKHLAGNEAQLALSKAIEIAKSCRACLMCYERDHKVCHRLIVAQSMTKCGDISVSHLGVRRGMSDAQHSKQFRGQFANAFG